MVLRILYVEAIWDWNTIEENRGVRTYTCPEDALIMRSNFGPAKLLSYTMLEFQSRVRTMYLWWACNAARGDYGSKKTYLDDELGEQRDFQPSLKMLAGMNWSTKLKGPPWPFNPSRIDSDRGNNTRYVAAEATSWHRMWWPEGRNENLSIQKANP